MRKNVEEFFLGLEEPNFLAMKLLLSLFERFESDEVSRRIVDNLSVLSQYDIRLICSEESFSYIDWFDNDFKRIDFAINVAGTETVACHEFGHLLLELFARGEMPEEFLSVNRKCRKRILNKHVFIKKLLQDYRDAAYDKLVVDYDDALEFYNRHPELRDEFFERYPDGTVDEMVEERLEEHCALVSAFDEDIENYNKVSNIVAAVFCGNNPFFLEYGKDNIDCVLAMHNDDYYKEGYYGKYVTSFEEQFADYLVLRTYPEKFGEAIGVLQKTLGDEWFEMMDKFYDQVTKRIGDKSKVYQYK